MIDPATAMTLSSAFTSVVGLIGQFKSGRDAASGSDFNDFMTWLVKSNHHEIKSMIEANHTTTIGIKAVLGQQSSELTAVLGRLDDMLTAFASTFAGFSDIGAGLNPSSVISDQALDILRQFESLGASTAIEIKLSGHTLLQAASGGNIKYEDARFLEDDLRTLARLGLLELDRNKSGNRVFHYTRAASALVKSTA
ncbi:hypothetical protein AUC61_14675 [Pseudomonas sp. S25]|uniref:Uncharacterized protein n=1 Tax=Pseudomonas maioricensis TaxID=1766623 RepID=A0ABS9ZJL9_9PSED|nr:hypothetical protein [Pseudomonas sp. S25]MCI8210780.1 hypothetical protein [Pseudomonas sp. S25]